MTKNQKIGTTIGVLAGLGGAFALGWWLHKPKASKITLDFNPSGVTYDVKDLSGNFVVNPSSGVQSNTLEAGEYTVDMSSSPEG
jgi:hypothetical protein